MKCRLCLEEKPLLKKSHIISNFMYKGLFDNRHFISLFDVNNADIHKRLPDGIYDREIMCHKCDNELLGSLETYANNVLYGGEGLFDEFQNPNIKFEKDDKGLISIHFTNINYSKFKLFLLSILWRAHISEHTFFREINIGKFAEKIRIMLLNNDPGKEDEFETCLVYLDSNDIPKEAIVEPRYLKFDGNSSYVFLINHIMYHFNLSKYNKASMFEKGRISKENTMEVALLKDKLANEYFDSYIGKKLRKI